MNSVLTRKQQEVYDLLVKRSQFVDQPPTLDELCVALNLKSRGSLHKHIQALVSAGLVEPQNGQQRGIRLSNSGENTSHNREDNSESTLPFMGYIAAGKPIEAIENPEAIEVPELLKTQKSCFVLQVKGDSMIEAGILDGDWVVIEKRETANSGDIVVALIDQQDATLKTFQTSKNEILLIPANCELSAMSFSPERVTIQGVLVGQMRSYQ